VRHDLYGTAVEAAGPHHLTTPSGAALMEFPMTTRTIAGITVPVSGGGYFRFYPYGLSAWLLRTVNARAQPFVFYMHPWEVDPEQPRIQAPLKSRFRHYTNLHSCEAKLRRLIGDFALAPMAEVIADHANGATLSR